MCLRYGADVLPAFLFLLPTLIFLPIFAPPGMVRLPDLPRSARLLLLTALIVAACGAALGGQVSVVVWPAWALMVAGLIGLGSRLTDPLAWRPLAWGLAVMLGTAGVWTLAQGGVRLAHPIWAATGVGLGGAMLTLLCAHLPGRVPLRVAGGVLGVAGVVASGSRGALLALIVAALITSGLRSARRAAVTAGVTVALLVALVTVGGRWVTPSDSGRELLWSNARAVIAEHPAAGVGRWQLGTLIWPDKKCLWWGLLEEQDVRCVEYLGNAQPQVMAHNAALHELGEAGVIGASVTYLLLGVAGVLLWRSRRAAPLGVLTCVTVMGLTDVPMLLPGPFAAGVTWLIVGSALTAGVTRRDVLTGAVVGAAALGVTLLPPLLLASRPDTRAITAQPISAALDPSRRYHDLRFNLIAPAGEYRLDLLACRETCSELRIITAQGGQRNVLMQVAPPTFPVTLRLRVLNDEGRTPRELAEWTVTDFGEFARQP